MSEELKTSEELAAEAETSAAETPEITETAAPEEPAETMADYAEELEASFKQIHEGDILTGTVIGVSESEITLDLKYYTVWKISQAILDLISKKMFTSVMRSPQP